VKFCKELGKSVSETFQMIKQTYGEEPFGRSVVFEQHKRFAQERDSLEDEELTVRPITVRIELKINVATSMLVNLSQNGGRSRSNSSSSSSRRD
jgi:hypothetical protein